MCTLRVMTYPRISKNFIIYRINFYLQLYRDKLIRCLWCHVYIEHLSCIHLVGVRARVCVQWPVNYLNVLDWCRSHYVRLLLHTNIWCCQAYYPSTVLPHKKKQTDLVVVIIIAFIYDTAIIYYNNNSKKFCLLRSVVYIL